jgi:hypothetical protein
MYVWVATETSFDGTMFIGAFTDREKGKAACAEHAARELDWEDQGDFSVAGPYGVEEMEVK